MNMINSNLILAFSGSYLASFCQFYLISFPEFSNIFCKYKAPFESHIWSIIGTFISLIYFIKVFNIFSSELFEQEFVLL